MMSKPNAVDAIIAYNNRLSAPNQKTVAIANSGNRIQIKASPAA